MPERVWAVRGAQVLQGATSAPARELLEPVLPGPARRAPFRSSRKSDSRADSPYHIVDIAPYSSPPQSVVSQVVVVYDCVPIIIMTPVDTDYHTLSNARQDSSLRDARRVFGLRCQLSGLCFLGS